MNNLEEIYDEIISKHGNKNMFDVCMMCMKEAYQKAIDDSTITVEDIVTLCRDFMADSHDGFVSNDTAYVEKWLENKQIPY